MYVTLTGRNGFNIQESIPIPICGYTFETQSSRKETEEFFTMIWSQATNNILQHEPNCQYYLRVHKDPSILVDFKS